MIVMVGAGPRTAAMGVATTTNAHSGSWSRARALECSHGYTGGSSTSGRSKSTQHILVVTTSNFGLNMLPVMVLDVPGHRESTDRPLKGPFSYGTAAEKIISDSKDSELAGCSHPLPIRWHRAAALSLSPDLAVDCGLVVRHICGNKRCAKVGHFRFGSQSDNEKDEAYHEVNPSCSREAFPELE